MERLTVKTGVYQNGQYEIIAGMKCGVELKDIFDRLAAYEDTGLEPEEVRSQKELFDYLVFDSTPSEDIERFKRLRELAEADREGRCVVLPCKVGDRVWFTKFMWNYAKQPIPAIVCGIKTFSSSGTFTFMALTDTNNVSRSFINQDIGKTVFLTRAEAEAALKERKVET